MNSKIVRLHFPFFFRCAKAFIFAVVIFAFITGCEQRVNDGYSPVQYNEKADLIEDNNRVLSKTPTQEEVFDARLKYELAEAEAGARTLAELDKKNKSIVEKSDVLDTLDSVLNRKPEKVSAEEQSRKFLAEKKFDEAVEAAMLIPQTAERDFMLADIVRVQLGRLFHRSTQTKEQYETLNRIISTAVKNTGKIADLQIRTELLNSISVACSGSGSDEQSAALLETEQFKKLLISCLKEAAASMRQNSGTTADEFSKASFFCDTARRLLKLGETDTAEECCGNAEKAAEYISNPIEASSILLNVAELYLLAGRAEKAAEVLKSKMLKPDKKIKIPESVSETDISNSADKMIRQRRNHLLSNLAVLQVWTSPAEEVRNTIADMDEGAERDDALSEVIETFLLSDSPQKAEDWLNEVSDTTLKNKLTEKVQDTLKKNRQ